MGFADLIVSGKIIIDILHIKGWFTLIILE